MAESPFHSGAPRDPAVETPKVAAPEPLRALRDDLPPRGRSLGVEDEGPLPEAWQSPLLSEDIGAKTGNYILSFGFPGSGKTTLHSFLLRYLMTAGPYKTEPMQRRSSSGVDYEVNRIVTEWMGQWQGGRFPEATATGEHEIRELAFEVQPLKGVRMPLEFSILEISGEMMQTVIPRKNQNPNLSRIIRELVGNHRIRLIILLIVHPEVHENDVLFTNFMTYLDANLGFDIRSRARLGIVISDPVKALDYLKRYKPDYQHLAELRGDHVEEFVQHFAPSTYRIYREWPNPRHKMITRLYIGQVDEWDGGVRLVRPDYTSISKIFDWIYFQFNGRYPGMTRLQRMMSWIRS